MKTLLVFLLASPLAAQTLSLSAPASVRPGQSATIAVRLAPATAAPIAALQWTLSAPDPLGINFGPTNPASGAAAAAAGKTRLDCAGAVCISVGLNANPIGAGDIALYTVSVPAGTPPQSVQLALAAPVAVSPTATSVALAVAAPITLVIPQAADLNGDSAVDDRDLQISLDQIQGRAPCASADLDGNGRCELADAMLLVIRRTVP